MSATEPLGLRCEYHENPLGIDAARPRLSWRVNDERRGARQTAYQVLVASSAEVLAGDVGDVWDSGKVDSDQSIHVEYAGPKLRPRTRCFWKVRTWDAGGEPAPFSRPAWWEMGLLRPGDWKARWIGSPEPTDVQQPGPCPMLRRVLKVKAGLERARVYATALGVCELRLNGRRVGDLCLAPGWTDFRTRVQVQTYDVTGLLAEGDNAIGVILGDGWWSGPLSRRHKKHAPLGGDRPAVLVQVELQYAGARREVIGTDASWRSFADGPIRASDIYDGETYDARKEIDGWDTASFDDGAWSAAEVVEPDRRVLCASAAPPVRRIETIRPVSAAAQGDGKYVFDLGQNMVGWARLRLPPDTPAGTAVTMRFAEMLDADGRIYTANLRGAKCTDVYVARSGAAAYEPRFTFHGFRYVEVAGYPGVPDEEAIEGVVLHADMPPTGAFECSHALVNRLQHNIVWGQKGNFLDVPTDCPQRDERLGWTGDIQVFIRTACFNMDVAGFITKWLTDLTDCQDECGSYPSIAPVVDDIPGRDGGPGWADAAVIVPWTIYLCYGDRRILERHYGSMQRYVEFLRTADATTRHNFGDWVNHDAHTPEDLVAAAFHARSVDLLSRIAAVLGRRSDAKRYAGRFRKLAREFQGTFLTRQGRLVGDTQTAYVLALRFGLLPEEMRARAVEHLVHDIEHGRYTNMWKVRKGHLSTGFLGAKDLTFALTEGGRLDVAYKLLLNEDYPSWLFPVLNGATTIWERWDGWTHDGGFQNPGMNSFNHYAYGAIGQWLYQCVAGLDVDAERPGYKHAIVRPRVLPDGGVGSAKASIETMYGRAASAWRIEGDRLHLDVTVPANATATVYVPAADAAAVTEGDRPAAEAEAVRFVEMRGACAVFEVGAGRYAFASAPWRG